LFFFLGGVWLQVARGQCGRSRRYARNAAARGLGFRVRVHGAAQAAVYAGAEEQVLIAQQLQEQYLLDHPEQGDDE